MSYSTVRIETGVAWSPWHPDFSALPSATLPGTWVLPPPPASRAILRPRFQLLIYRVSSQHLKRGSRIETGVAWSPRHPDFSALPSATLPGTWVLPPPPTSRAILGSRFPLLIYRVSSQWDVVQHSENRNRGGVIAMAPGFFGVT